MRIMTSEAFPRWALFPPTEADKRVWKDHGPLEMAPVHFHDFWKAGVYIYIYTYLYMAQDVGSSVFAAPPLIQIESQSPPAIERAQTRAALLLISCQVDLPKKRE